MIALMTLEKIPESARIADFFHHIDAGFINRRLCLKYLGPLASEYTKRSSDENHHMAKLANDHLLTTMVIDVCQHVGVPTLWGAIASGESMHMFRSDHRLEPCPEVYDEPRVSHEIFQDLECQKRIVISYHTSHLVSDTGTMVLSEGHQKGYVESIVGRLHDRGAHYEVEPLIIGSPWLDHPRNNDPTGHLMWIGRDHGEILPQDIEQFAKMVDVNVANSDEWMSAMRELPEEQVKQSIANLLNEPTKKDWGGESNDHFSGNVVLNGKTRTAAFLLKGLTNFREMTLEMCGKRADQIVRLVNSGADISIVQHSHLVGEAVRQTLRALSVFPGNPGKFCIIDGQSTYRILKAYDLI